MRISWTAAALALWCAACSTAAPAQAPPPTPSKPIVPVSPPKDDGKAAQGGNGGGDHAAALEELKVAPIASKPDKQNSLLVPLPDAEHWTRVRFLTVKSLVGFRYGKDHHAIFGGLVTHVDDNNVQGACSKSFEQWAQPFIDAFDIEINHDQPSAFSWSPFAAPHTAKKISIVDVDPVRAKTATILSHEAYEAAWAAYPAWGDNTCLIVGVAIPARDDPGRAKEVRDRFVKDVFPKLVVTGATAPPDLY